MGPDASADIVVRSVNHRFLDLTVKVRETENELEPVVRRIFSRNLARGKVEVTVRVKRGVGAEREVSIDEGLLEAVLSRFAAVSAKYPIAQG